MSYPPRIIAQAIAEVLADDVRAAWRYQDLWAAMTSYGVPVTDVRHSLDVDPGESQPMATLDKWTSEGTQGILGFVGHNGTGKTYAAARWVMRRHEAGLTTTWLSAVRWGSADTEGRKSMIRRAANASALVLDDLDAGDAGGAWFEAGFTGVLQERLGDALPSLLAVNGELAELRELLGPRLGDRMRLSGALVKLASTKTMRARDTDKVDAGGRGRRWHAARKLIYWIGCEAVQRYDDDGEPLRIDLDVGGALERATRREGMEHCERVTSMFEIPRGKVRARASQIANREILDRGWAHEEHGIDIEGDISLDSIIGAMAAKFEREQLTRETEMAAGADRARAERDQREETYRAELAKILASRRSAGNSTYEDRCPGQPPKWLLDDRGKPRRDILANMGIRIALGGDGWCVRLMTRWTKKGVKPEIKAWGCETEAEAWATAATLFEGALPPPAIAATYGDS